MKQTLEARPGYYHIIHFDGHGGFLYGPLTGKTEGILAFEDNEGREYAVGAERLGEILSKNLVPIMVLNACQSAMMGEQAADPFASVAASLLKAGVRSVVAMGYSLYIGGAKQFVSAFYAQLFRDGTAVVAMRAGRQAMCLYSELDSVLGKTTLQDWIVPELYQQAKMGERILPVLRVPRNSVTKNGLPDEVRKTGDYGFIGRGRAVHELERILQRQKQAGILIHGMVGKGKTALVKGFLTWLQNTGGLWDEDGASCPVKWFDFRNADRAAVDIIDRLAKELLGRNNSPCSKDRLDKLTQYLKNHRAFMLHCAFDEPVTIEVKGVNSVRKDLKDVVQRLLNLLAELERRDGVLISYLEL